MQKFKSVAIDGPAGAGKSTIARRLAAKLGYIYVDTGALYRAVGYSAVKSGVPLDDAAKIVAHIKNIKVGIVYRDGEQRVILNDEDVSGFIRTPEVSAASSKVSAVPEVRSFLLGTQRRLAAESDVIMDGRDIATVVLPDADVKIFLTASVEERAKRRFLELTEKGEKVDMKDVLADMKERDYRDTHRETAPLRPAETSVKVDTTGLDLEQSVAALEKIVNDVIAKGEKA